MSFDFPEPNYHAQYVHRLPACRFNAPFNEIRLPAHFLDTPLKSADLIWAKLAERECVQELSRAKA